jgi:hypothetical protein
MAFSAVEIIGGVVLTTTPTVVYTGLSNQNAQISQFILFNSDTVNAHLVNVWLGSGHTDADQVGSFIIPSQTTYSVYQILRLIVSAGQIITLQTDLDGVVTCKASASILTS